MTGHIVIAVWSPLLRDILGCYLEHGRKVPVKFLDMAGKGFDRIYRTIQNADIFIAEAYNPYKIAFAEGFQLAMQIVAVQANTKPLVIFRHLEISHSFSPHFIDYGHFSELPVRLSHLLSLPSGVREHFDKIILEYPELNTKPVHGNAR